MSAEENLELVRWRFTAHPMLVDADDALREIYSPDVVLYGPGERFVGIEGIKQAGDITRAAFSEIEMAVEEMTAEGEDRVVTRIVGHSRHTGEFQGVPPSGKRVTVRGVIVSRIKDGRIVEEWRNMTWGVGDGAE